MHKLKKSRNYLLTEIPPRPRSIYSTNSSEPTAGPTGRPRVRSGYYSTSKLTRRNVNIYPEPPVHNWTNRPCPESWIHFTNGLHVWAHIFCENSLSYIYDFGDPVRPQLCTCHDSSAVVICAILWPDRLGIVHVRAIWILKDLDCKLKPFAKWVPEVEHVWKSVILVANWTFFPLCNISH